MTPVFIALLCFVTFIAGVFAPSTYRAASRAIAAPKQKKQLTSGGAKVSALEKAKKKGYEERARKKGSSEAIGSALSYIQRGEDVDWGFIIRSRLDSPGFVADNLRDFVKEISVKKLDSFTPEEQSEIIESCVAGWVDCLKKAVSLRMAEEDILSRAVVVHNQDVASTPLALETVPASKSWEDEFAQIGSPVDNEPRAGQ